MLSRTHAPVRPAFSRILRDYLVPTLAMAAACLVCLLLARWQWDAGVGERRLGAQAATSRSVPFSQVSTAEQTLKREMIGVQTKVSGRLIESETFTTQPRPTSRGPRAWVVTPLMLSDGTAIAVVRGAGEPLRTGMDVSIGGRMQPSEDSPAIGMWTPPTPQVSTDALVNRWPFPVIRDGYLVAADTATMQAGGAVATPRFTSAPAGSIGWRNLAYAFQWALFAIFALFVWWRHIATLREEG